MRMVKIFMDITLWNNKREENTFLHRYAQYWWG